NPSWRSPSSDFRDAAPSTLVGISPRPPATTRRTAPSLPAPGGCARSASAQRLDRDVLANLVAELEADSDGLGRPFDAKFATTALGAL
ncbi:MAG: hypothetical protein WCI96_06460, partial [Planctomycetota bacterium]